MREGTLQQGSVGNDIFLNGKDTKMNMYIHAKEHLEIEEG